MTGSNGNGGGKMAWPIQRAGEAVLIAGISVGGGYALNTERIAHLKETYEKTEVAVLAELKDLSERFSAETRELERTDNRQWQVIENHIRQLTRIETRLEMEAEKNGRNSEHD